jgi:hypothetical protein
MSMRYQAGIVLPGYNPLKVPNAPTIGTATGGIGAVSVTFTAPADVGGGAITGYSVVSTPSGIIGTGASSPVTVSGLTGGTAYTFKVFATNAFGSSPLSAASNSATPVEPAPTVIGQAYGGGYYAGQIGVSSVATHYIVVGPVASAQNTSIKYKNANTVTAGSDSDIDGPQNTADMVADGSSTVYPAAHFCNDLVIGGYTDWYMPAKNELEVCYYNLKPNTNNNSTSSGINPNAVPARASNYTTGTPAQTSATDFRSTGSEDFIDGNYWTSTEYNSAQTWYGSLFSTPAGFQFYGLKNYLFRVRAIRRVAV